MKEILALVLMTVTTFISATSFAEPVTLRDGSTVELSDVVDNSIILRNGEICGVQFNIAKVRDHRGSQWSTVDGHIATRVHQNESIVLCRLSGRNSYAMVLRGGINTGSEYDTLIIYVRLY